jgi:hypothetical protein
MYVCIYIHKTNDTDLSPSWESNRSSALQEIPRILWTTTVHYSNHKSPQLVPMLSKINRVQVTSPIS